MPIFYEQAIRAEANGDPIDWIQDDHLSEWRGLASALDRLTPEQRCDAIYADWLLQLPRKQARLPSAARQRALHPNQASLDASLRPQLQFLRSLAADRSKEGTHLLLNLPCNGRKSNQDNRRVGL